MATGFNTQVGNGEYRLQFETDNKEYYLLMQETARRCVDGERVGKADRCVCCGAIIPEGGQVCTECQTKGDDKKCPWCKAEYTIIDDDFGQPVHPTKVRFCFNCGRRLR